MGPFTETPKGFCHILVMEDHFTKWVEAIPLKGQTGEEVVNTVMDYWVVCHGVHLRFHSDNGSKFDNKLYTSLYTSLYTATPSYNPCSNEMEMVNRSINSLLHSCAASEMDWDKKIPAILFSHISLRHDSIMMFPFFTMFG